MQWVGFAARELRATFIRAAARRDYAERVGGESARPRTDQERRFQVTPLGVSSSTMPC